MIDLNTFYEIDELPRGNYKVSKDWRSHHKDANDNRPFVMWDGEGINFDGMGKAQNYVLFGCSTGEYIQDKNLATIRCFELMLECGMKYPNAIHVGFSFKYDVEMILRDLPIPHWRRLRKKNSVHWRGYYIQYIPGKWIRLSHRESNRRILISDVWSFFQASFVKSLKAWLPENELAEIERIESGKNARNQFAFDELETMIKPYWQAELRLGVVLMNRLRELLTIAGVCPGRWHGPGAIATRIYKQRNIRSKMARIERFKDAKIDGVLPKPVYDAARIAYAGGRFELFKMGHYPSTVYQYDINSAYPAAIRTLPNLSAGRWVRVTPENRRPGSFSIWHINLHMWGTNPQTARVVSLFTNPAPLPFHRRTKDNRVTFPANVDSWIWEPEATIAFSLSSDLCTILEGWEFIPDDPNDRPFDFVNEMYKQRQEWKREGNAAEKALKLALNSLYGKMAQRVGFNEENDRLPPFYQLEWAGYVTSFTRAKIYAAMIDAGLQNVIACETDSIFSTVPVPSLPITTELGDWSFDKHDWITYLQSGTYWVPNQNGVKAKYRGLDPNTLSHEAAMEWLRNGDFDKPIITMNTRFIGAGRGLGKEIHRAWVSEPREMVPGRSGKRVHTKLCPQCRKHISAAEGLHILTCSDVFGGKSEPHALPWEDNEFRNVLDEDNWDHAEILRI